MCAHHVGTLKSMNEREMSISKVLERTRNVRPISDFIFVLVWYYQSPKFVSS